MLLATWELNWHLSTSYLWLLRDAYDDPKFIYLGVVHSIRVFIPSMLTAVWCYVQLVISSYHVIRGQISHTYHLTIRRIVSNILVLMDQMWTEVWFIWREHLSDERYCLRYTPCIIKIRTRFLCAICPRALVIRSSKSSNSGFLSLRSLQCSERK